jgi:Ca2+-binding EF-hand superfamily protein
LCSLKPGEEEIETLLKTMQPDENGMINFQDKLNLYLRDEDGR